MATFEKAFKRNRTVDTKKEHSCRSNYLSHYQSAMNAYNSQNLSSALENINITIEKSDINDWKQYAFRANVQEDLGKYFEAITDYEKAIDFANNDINVYALYHQIAFCYLASGNNLKAVEFFNYSIELKTNHPNDQINKDIEGLDMGVLLGIPFKKIYNNRANAQLNLGNLNESLKDCNMSLSYDRNYSNPYLVKSEIYRKAGQEDKANEFLKISAQLGNRNAIIKERSYVYFNRGIEKGEIKSFTESIAEFSKAIEIDPNFEKAYNLRGAVKGDIQNFDGAIADFTKAIEIDPNFASAYSNRGFAKNGKKDFDGAISDCTKAIEIDPYLVHAYNNRGIAKNGKKDFDDAITDFTKAIEIDPYFVHAYNNRGCAKTELSDYVGAISDYYIVIKIDPRFAAAYNNRGIAKCNFKDLEGAITDYTKAIEINSNFAFAFNNRGNAKKSLNDNRGAIADYTKAIEIDPNYAIAYKNRGDAKREIGDLFGAEIDHSKSLSVSS